MSRYIISPSAIRDLEDIIDYLSEQSIDVGERFLAEFDQKCRNLVQFPNIGRSYDDLLLGMRGILLTSYIIFYRPINGGIEIVRVISGYRDLPTIFENL